MGTAISERLAAITIIGGTDGPTIQLVPDGHGGFVVKRIPGWNPEQLADLAAGLQVITAASRLKTAGVAEQAYKSVGSLIEKQLGEHVAGANVVVFGA